MHWLKRILGAICVLLSSVGFLAFAGDLIGIWLVRGPLTASSTRVLGRIEEALGLVTRGLADLDTSLGKAERNLRQYQNASAGGDGGKQNKLALDLVAWQLKSEVAPDIGKVRESLVGVSEAAVVINSLLADVSELPSVHFDPLDPEQLRGVTGTLSHVGRTAQELSRLLEEGKMAESQEASSRMQDALERVRAAVAEFNSHLSDIEARVITLKARLPHGIDVGAIVLSLVFFWLAISQVSLLIHGWAWLRNTARAK